MSELILKIERIMRAFVPEATPYIDVEKKNSIWEDFSLKNNGSFKIVRSRDHTFSRLRMEIPLAKYTVKFEESDTHLLRIKCDIGCKDFMFYISFEDLIEKIIKTFNNNEIEIGDKEFDDKYLITTNDERKMVKILSDRKLKDLLIKNDVSNFHLDNGELFILGNRHLNSMEELNDILEIFKNVISKI